MVEAVADELFSPRLEVRPPFGERYELKLEPASYLHASVRFAESEDGSEDPAPDSADEVDLTARLLPAGVSIGRTPGLRALLIPCDQADERYRCTIPAGRWDVALKGEGYLTHYFWGLDAPRGESIDLGSLELVPGAAISGWVTTADAAALPEDTRVVLATQGMGDAETRREAVRRERTEVGTAVNDRGFFVLSGLEPGSYELIVDAEGYASKRIGPIPVYEGSESEIRRIELARPLTLTLFITPQVDPFGEPWTVELLEWRQGGRPRQLDKSRAGAAGFWEHEELPAGRYLVSLHTSQGDRFHSESLELDPHTPSITIEVEPVWVEGTLLLGDAPLSAAVKFIPTGGGSTVRLISDLEGIFGGILPRAGLWDVQVESIRPNVGRKIHGVEVELESPGLAERLTLELPDNRLRGSAVDTGGKPVEGAIVDVYRQEGGGEGARTTTDEEGRFELTGFEPDTWWVEASAPAGGLSAPPTPVSIRDSETEVTLTLRQSLRVRGILRSGEAPVGGAVVVCLPLVGNGTPFAPVRETTDVDGSFECELAARGSQVQLVAMAAGYPLTTRIVDGERPLVFELARQAGSLVIEDAALDPRLEGLLLIHESGAVLNSMILSEWATALGGLGPNGLRLPRLATGGYTVCVVPGDEAASIGSTADLRQQWCRRAQVSAGGEFHLSFGESSP